MLGILHPEVAAQLGNSSFLLNFVSLKIPLQTGPVMLLQQQEPLLLDHDFSSLSVLRFRAALCFICLSSLNFESLKIPLQTGPVMLLQQQEPLLLDHYFSSLSVLRFRAALYFIASVLKVWK